MKTTSIKNVAVLGSTGSIGCSTLDVVRANRDKFRIVALSCGSNIDLLSKQIDEFEPEYVAVGDEQAAVTLRSTIGSELEIGIGSKGIDAAASWNSAGIVVAAVVGFAGLSSVLSAIKAGKDIALANKEALVAGGHLVKQALAHSVTRLIPVDSEHNSIYQCLMGELPQVVKRITLTASGGPFLHTNLTDLAHVTPEQAVKHPRWNMGAKISIDSATMMNKGLEVIEASWLFNLPQDLIDVVVHPQSIVHGVVEYIDGMSHAALSVSDMRVAISFALGALLGDANSTHGVMRLRSGVAQLSLLSEKLEFFPVDEQRFPALGLCFQALAEGGGATTVLNAANEVAVSRFLKRDIQFTDIPKIVRRSLDAYTPRPTLSFEEVLEVDAWSRDFASNVRHTNA